MNQKYTVNEKFFHKWNEHSSYLLGFIAADGNIELDKYKRPNRLTVCLSTKDIDFLQKLKNLLNFSGPIKTSLQLLKINNKIYSNSAFRISNRILCQKLFDLGVKNKKSLTLKWIKSIPKKYINHFVRGYFDGDGCIIQRKDKTKNPAICILGTSNFMKSIKKEFAKTTETASGSIRKRENIHILYINGFPGCKAFMKWIYKNSTVSLERKKNKFDLIYPNQLLCLQ